MSKSFREWNVDQVWLLPPSINDFVPSDHVAHFVRDTVRTALDLGLIYRSYRSERGQPPFHPAMMVALLLYAYSQGVYASRRIAKGCEERVDCRQRYYCMIGVRALGEAELKPATPLKFASTRPVHVHEKAA